MRFKLIFAPFTERLCEYLKKKTAYKIYKKALLLFKVMPKINAGRYFSLKEVWKMEMDYR